MQKEIGSSFWLDRYYQWETQEINLDFLQLPICDVAFLSTGRSAISFVLKHIGLPKDNKVALLPPFTCHTVLQPFIDAGYKVHCYDIDKDLTCNRDAFAEAIFEYQPSVVLVHGYFGFDTLHSIKELIKGIGQSGITMIEDITQTMYSEYEHTQSDYYVASFRKWAALPDGACAISTNKPFTWKPHKVDASLEDAKLRAFHAKHLYMYKNIGNKEEFLRMFREAEDILCSQESIFAMSPVSRAVQGNLDIDLLRRKRKHNYDVLAHTIEDVGFLRPVFSTLPKDVTPLYFPVYVERDREGIQRYLAKNDIYAPIVWPKPIRCEGAISETVDWIYRHILSIPCDQRYDIDDMERIIDTLIQYDDRSVQSNRK